MTLRCTFVSILVSLVKTTTTTTTTTKITIGNTVIRPSLSVRNLGVTFDSAMTMSNHISSICKTLNFHLRNLSRVRIDKTTCHHTIRALVTSRLDYANSLQIRLVKKLAIFNDSKTELKNLYLWPKSLIMFSPSLNNFTGFLFINILILKSGVLFLNATVIAHLHTLKNLSLLINQKVDQKLNLKSSSKGFYSAALDLWNGLPCHSPCCIA